jgi:hypothetical protein
MADRVHCREGTCRRRSARPGCWAA